ncbi:MAG: hypothetical protein N2Z20_02195 [Elusimicrobiales bacterium]|nr:hypothetical protein [Elusimicrobiales bacterium]
MKKFFFYLLYLSITCNNTYSGEVLPGSVPGSIVYQGRIEKNNAPLNGIVHLNFKIYGSLTGSDMLWESGYITAEARAGIFSVTFNPPLNIFTQGQPRYIEIEVEGERLTPREKINSVIYSMISKKLEDGASLHLASAVIGIPLSSYPNYYNQKLIVYGGGIYTDQICFYPLGNCMSAPGEATVTSTLFSSSTVRIRADIDNDYIGDILFETRGANEIARFSNNGNFGIGTTNPIEKLHISGNAYISNNLTIGNDINYSGIFNAGILRGQNLEQINVGVTDNRIDFIVNGITRASLNGSNLGIGTTNPSYSLDVYGDMRGYTLNISTINLNNEIRNLSGHINLQSSSIYNVGIGTSTPTEKLHVAGTIKSDNGILTTSATFTSDVNILGNLYVTKYGKKIELSSTTVYGTLNVVGEFLVNQDKIAALASSQTYSGINTFTSKTNISSHIYITNGLMVYGANSEAFGSGKYIQIGNPLSATENAILYLAGGTNASSRLNFYTGNTNKIVELSATLNSFRITHSNSDTLKFYIDSSSTTIYGPIISLSTSVLATPVIYINSNGNTGIGITNPDEKLVVKGSIKLSGSGSSIVFSDGTTMDSASLGSASGVSSPGDATIYADSDVNGSGSIILKTNNITAGIITNSGKIGFGTLNPQEKLHIIGDVMIGNTLNPYSGDSKSDLLVEGNLVVDGYFKQRSTIPAEFESIYIRGNVFLSTGTTSKTGIGTLNPSYRLDVDGDINLTGGLRINGIQIISTSRSMSNLTGISSSGDINFSGLSPLRLVATDNSSRLVSSISSTDLMNSVSGTTGTGNLVFASNPTLTNPTINTGIIVSGWGNFSQGVTASSGTFTNTGDYSLRTSSGINVLSGTINLNNTVRIKNLPSPIESSDAATKDYVDQIGGGGSDTGAWVKSGNNIGVANNLGSINDKDIDFIRNNSTQFSMLSSGVNFYVPIISNNHITASSATFSSNGVGAPIIRFTNNVYISSTTSSNYGGIYVSTHIYLPSGSIYYGNGSGITNVNAANVTCSDCVSLTSETQGDYVSNINGGTGISVSGTPGEGWTPTISLTGQALALHNLSTNGIIVRTNSANITARTITAGSGISVTNGDGINGNPTISVSESALNLNNLTGPLNLNKGGTGTDLSSASNGPVKKSGAYLTVASINLASEVSGILPTSNGGTGNNTFSTNQPIIYNGTSLSSFSGFNGSFIVAKSTDSTKGCMQLNFQYGILSSTQTATCP